MSIMHKFIYDSLKFESMIDFPFYHAHANGNTSKIVGRVNNVQVRFNKRKLPLNSSFWSQQLKAISYLEDLF